MVRSRPKSPENVNAQLQGFYFDTFAASPSAEQDSFGQNLGAQPEYAEIDAKVTVQGIKESPGIYENYVHFLRKKFKDEDKEFFTENQRRYESVRPEVEKILAQIESAYADGFFRISVAKKISGYTGLGNDGIAIQFHSKDGEDLILKFFHSSDRSRASSTSYARYVEDFPAQIEALRRTKDMARVVSMHSYSFEHSVIIMKYEQGNLLLPNKKNFVHPTQKAIEGAISDIYELAVRGVESGGGGDDFIYNPETDSITILDPKFRNKKWTKQWQESYEDAYKEPATPDTRLAVQLLWFLEVLVDLKEKELGKECEKEEYYAAIKPLFQSYFLYNQKFFPEKINVLLHQAARSRDVSSIMVNAGIYEHEVSREQKYVLGKAFLEALIS